jgi:hypothetical protein
MNFVFYLTLLLLIPSMGAAGELGAANLTESIDLTVRSNSSKSSGLKSRLGNCPYAPVV